MKVVAIEHPQSTYPNAVEAVCLKLAKEFRLHSTQFLPGQIQGTGKLVLFFEPKSKLKVVEFKKSTEGVEETAPVGIFDNDQPEKP